SLCFECRRHHGDLHSFPTRRSSDLSAAPTNSRKSGAGRVGRDLNSGWNWLATNQGWSGSSTISTSRPSYTVPETTSPASTSRGRSEEHTSELQSPCNLVCRLLLEKK